MPKKKKKKSFMDRLAQIDPEMLGQLFTSVQGMFNKSPGGTQPPKPAPKKSNALKVGWDGNKNY